MSAGHPRWTRVTHWIIAASVLTLAFSGVMILMVHPRLYWGETGNDLTPALIELPISRNYQHGGWEASTPFSAVAGAVAGVRAEAPLSAVRTYDIFNQNGWGRSLHFLAAWFLLVTGAVYVFAGVVTGHARRDLMPRARELRPRAVWRDWVAHAGLRIPAARRGPPYGILQKLAYSGVVFVALPMMVITGCGMSPAINAAVPWLSGMFGGNQSARTLHFCFFTVVMLFLVAHVVMVLLTGVKAQMRGMVLGK